jgi:outer membrane protein OmpA-like peptidoglycan-associated protein
MASLKSAGAKVRVAGGINPILAERDDVISTVQKVIPHFVKNLQEGRISYDKDLLSVHGLAMEKPLLDAIQKDLSGAKVKIHTNLALNLRAIQVKEATRKAKEEAERKAVEAKRKAEQEEEAIRKAQEKAARRAKEEAERKAAEAAKRAQEERLAQEEAARKAKEVRQAKVAEALLQAQQEAEARRVATEARKAAAAKMAVAPAMSAEEIAKIKANRQAARDTIAALLEVEIIEFDSAKSSLTPKGENTVDKLAVILQNYPLIKVEIAGHTDSDGNDKFNQKLSQTRVDTVKNELVSQGINSNKLKAIGYGESKPLVPNTTAENKQKNRRVKIIVIGE